MILPAIERSMIFAAVLCTSTLGMTSDWPQSGIDTIAAKCHQRPRTDVPSQYQTAYCACQTMAIAAAIPWEDFANADMEARTRDLDHISTKAEGTMIAAAMVGARCFEQVVPH
jgi:hypothetical protein